MQPGEFNRKHPELRKGEVFMGNVRPGPNGTYVQALKKHPRKVKPGERLGTRAYDIYGNPAEDLRPLFVKEPRGSKRTGR